MEFLQFTDLIIHQNKSIFTDQSFLDYLSVKEDYIEHLIESLDYNLYISQGKIELPLIYMNSKILQLPFRELEFQKLSEKFQKINDGVFELEKEDPEVLSNYFQDKNSKKNVILKDILSNCPSIQSIQAEFSKILIFETRGEWKRQKFPKIKNNHFATLLLFLPCEYSGGDLIVSSVLEEKVFNFSITEKQNQNEPFKMRWIMLFTEW